MVNKALHRYHPRKDETFTFSSLAENDFDAKQEMSDLATGLREGRKFNREVDSRTGGGIVHGVKYCVSSMPGEETFGGNSLWISLVHASTTAIKRTFHPETCVSLGCVWSDADSPDTWWPRWRANQMLAYEDGQTLLVYDRRDWELRTEPVDLDVPAVENRLWPGKPLTKSANEPLKQYGDTQAREIAWLERQVDEGIFERSRVQYRPIKTLDEIRAVTEEGNSYRGVSVSQPKCGALFACRSSSVDFSLYIELKADVDSHCALHLCVNTGLESQWTVPW
eukprot:COSAG02_NODE_3461_length_6697_cov_572.132161_7_plen_280_part_00